MKTRVMVLMRAEREVEIEVEHGEDEDPTDLTREDQQNAKSLADSVIPEWEVVSARTE